jgi:transcription elongation factor Elf1
MSSDESSGGVKELPESDIIIFECPRCHRTWDVHVTYNKGTWRYDTSIHCRRCKIQGDGKGMPT